MTTSAQHGGHLRGGNSPAPRKKKRGGLSGWFTSASGILASFATIVAAVASVLAAHQTSRADQLTIIVRQQRQEIKQAQLASKGQQPGNPGTSSGATGGAPAQGGTYLSALQPTVDNEDLRSGPQVMSAKSYPDSVAFYCWPADGSGQPAEAFDVAGHSVFSAVVGIPDDTDNVTSMDETVTFADQSGAHLMSPVTVSLGHPATVRLNISGVTQLAVTCTGLNTQTQQTANGNPIALGNARIS